MSNREMYRKEDDRLDRATAALRDADIPPGPSDALLNATLARLESTEASPNDSTHSRRILSVKAIIKLAIAACIAIVIGALVWNIPTHRSSVAFGDVVKHVRDTNSVRFKMTTVVDLPNAPKQSVESTVIAVGTRMKQNMGTMSVMLIDFDAGEMLSIQPQMKQAMRMKMENIPEQAKHANLLMQFRQLKTDQAKDLGTKEVDGKTLHGFEVVNGPQIMKVWADPETERPVVVETVFDMLSSYSGTAVMKDFEWEVAIDPAEMSLEIPEGFTVRDVNVDASPATESDLIESLRVIATLNEGKFPDTFDMAGLSAALKGSATAMTQAKDEESRTASQTAMMTSAMQVSRGMTFIHLGNGDDFRYAGRGASLNEPGRAVFWYQPNDSQKYRVVDATLSVSEVASDAIPKIESTRLKAGASPYPTTKPVAK